MLRCSTGGVFLLFYCGGILAMGGVSVWYTIHLRGHHVLPWYTSARPRRGRGQALPQGLAQEPGHLIAGLEWAKARDGARVGEIPLVLGNADEIANGRVAGPGAPQRRLGQLRGHAGAQEGADVATRGDGFDGG